jgi:hypothetical protein
VADLSEIKVDIEDVLPYFEGIIAVTSLHYGRNPNRMRAIAGQIARNAIAELRRPKLVDRQEIENVHCEVDQIRTE